MADPRNSDGPLPPKDVLRGMYIDKQNHLKEQQVRMAEIHIVREVLEECAATEGVNAKENCNHLVRQYLKMLKTHELTGYRKFHREKYYQTEAPSPFVESLDKETKAYLGPVGIAASAAAAAQTAENASA